MNYYNEFDANAAAWLRELIKRKLIPDGEVDERSILDVRADDLAGFEQCHFFAGVGGWALALRLAGIPDDFPIWTGSCPCQPFSNAGKKKGIKDERDLWPMFFNLIKECQPPFVFGEQVASAEVVGSELEAAFVVAVQQRKFARANKLAKKLATHKGFHFHKLWLDRVCSDLESAGYSVRPEVLGAHSVAAPHQRQRLYWGAYSLGNAESNKQWRHSVSEIGGQRREAGRSNSAGGLAQDSSIIGRGGRSDGDSTRDDRQVQAAGLGACCGVEYSPLLGSGKGQSHARGGSCGGGKEQRALIKCASGGVVSLAHSDGERCDGERISNVEGKEMSQAAGGGLPSLPPYANFGFILCTDTDETGRHKVRRVPVESVLFGLADGVSEGVDGGGDCGPFDAVENGFPLSEKLPAHNMLIKGYGNAINPWCGKVFIEWFFEQENEKKEASPIEVLERIEIYPDGNQWCVLVGDNIQEGVCGFGITPMEAFKAYVKNLRGDEND